MGGAVEHITSALADFEAQNNNNEEDEEIERAMMYHHQ